MVDNIEQYRCLTCRENQSGEKLKKIPLGPYKKNVDGKLEVASDRYSIFCKVCDNFLAIVDTQAQKELQKRQDLLNQR